MIRKHTVNTKFFNDYIHSLSPKATHEINPDIGIDINLDFDFTLESGNIAKTILFVGPNGTGKTSILENIYSVYFAKNPWNDNSDLNSLHIKKNSISDADIIHYMRNEVENYKKSYNANSEAAWAHLQEFEIVKALNKAGFEYDHNLRKNGHLLMHPSEGEKNWMNFFIHLLYIEDGYDFICWDEPDSYLSLEKQQVWLDIINQNIGANTQLFIATHSEQIIRSALNCDKTLLFLLKEDNANGKVHIVKKINGGMSSLWSLGRVLYEVFDIATNDYHNELYANIQATHGSIKDCDNFFIKQTGNIRRISYFINQKTNKKITYQCLSTMIRNHIDHPDNQSTIFSPTDLKQSIDFLKTLQGI
jgi:predicted ATPase